MPSNTPPFPNSPLVLTVLEIRYPEIAGWIGKEIRNELKEALAGHLPLMEAQTEQQIAMAIGVATPMSVQQETFPRFCTRNRTTALVVKKDALVLETTDYEGWEEHFRPLVCKVVTALEQVCAPDGVLRIGLRYIDEIRVPGIDTAPGDWRGYINEHLLAAADPDFIPASLKPSIWQEIVQYRTPADSILAVRYGPQEGYAVDPEGPTRRSNPPSRGLFFLLDSDSSWTSEEVPEFGAEWILERCDLLHAPVREFFHIAITDKLRDDVFSKQEGEAP